MSSTALEHRHAVRRRLAFAVSPREVVDGLHAWLEEHGVEGDVALYLAHDDGRLQRDDAFGASAHSPETVGDDDTVNGTLLRFDFRDRPFGALLLPAPVAGAAEFLHEDFAPALFRALYLDDTLRDNETMREQLFYLDEMGKLLGQLDLDLLLVNVLELTAAYLGADIGSITLQRPDGLVTAVDWGLPHDAFVSLRRADGTMLTDAIAGAGEAFLVTSDDLDPTSCDETHVERLLVLPLCTNEAFWGSINLLDPHRAPDANAAPLEAIRSGVGLAATAIENALLLEIKLSNEREQEQLKLGQQIQDSLLPATAPQRDGVQIAGSSVSATMIGGDYYDYFELPDGRLGLVVADVSGKGVPAGLIMTATRALFRATTARRSDPAGILGEVNRLLCAEGFGSRFVTAIFLALDPAHGEFEYSTAGHDPPLVWRAGPSRVESDPVPALPLGLRPAATFDARTVVLEAGDALVAYTDGVSEAMNEDREQFGEDRLHDALRDGASDTAPALRDRILGSIARHCGPIPRHDDTTMIVVRRTTSDQDDDPSIERTEP